MLSKLLHRNALWIESCAACDLLWYGEVAQGLNIDARRRCSEQNRRKAVTQSYGTTATFVAKSAEPPANDRKVEAGGSFFGEKSETA